jgi:hypothetical protein
MKINLNESLTGFKRTIQHLDGRYVLIQHPADQPIAPSLLFFFRQHFSIKNDFLKIDSMKKIPNQGMISMETHHTGDLIIQFDVEFPSMNFFNDPSILQVNN